MPVDAAFELLTPAGRGGIAVVAVSGSGRYAAAARRLRAVSGEALDPGCCRRPTHALLVLDGEVVDEVIVVDRPHAAVVELHLHGSEAVVARLEAEAPFGRPAPTGVDRLLRVARDPAQLALALEQRAVDWRGYLARLDELAPDVRADEIDAALARGDLLRVLFEPARLVLCGPQNAGKSTLTNRLLLEERSLTGRTPGLTRDPVSSATVLAGYPYELVDTAGEGEIGSEIDRRALERGRGERVGALLLVVLDGSRRPSPDDRELCLGAALVVRNKADLAPADWGPELVPDLAVSCLQPGDGPAIRAAIGEALRRRRGLPVPGLLGGPAAFDAGRRADLASRRGR